MARTRARIAERLCSLGLLALVAMLVQVAGAAPGLPPSDVALRVDGADLVDDSGEPVSLRAINLGNWFLLEMWMYGVDSGSIPDQATFISVLESRFGEAEARRLLGLHRAGWMRQRDFDTIAASGFNCVRIPVSHVLLEREPFVLDEEGFALLGSALEMAEEAGLYVIIDMHSVPGGQSTDQPSGDISQNEIWTDPVAQERLAWLWQHVARRFKNQRNWVAYDLINEPFGNFHDDIRGPLLDICDRVIRAIRIVDPNRLIFVPGTINGVEFYGVPADRGWNNTGLTEHFYPGIFDGAPATLGVQARFISETLAKHAAYSRSVGAPYLLGEFNPVFDRAGSPEVVRAVMEKADELDIHAAVWSYKIVTAGGGVGPDNWYLVTNEDPFSLGDIRTASLASIEASLVSLATMALAIDQPYVDAMLAEPAPDVLPQIEALPFEPPAADLWTGWSIGDIGNVAYPGGQQVVGGGLLGADALTLYASGYDLFGQQDSLRFASRAMPPSFVVSGVFDAFGGSTYAQTGVMIRGSSSPGSAHVALTMRQDGRVFVKSRLADGIGTFERYIGNSGFPVGLGIGRSGGGFVGWMTDEDGVWREVPIWESPAVGSSPLGGFYGFANRSGPLSIFRIGSPRVDLPGTVVPGPTLDAGVNMLSNPSFESASGVPSRPSAWPSWSDKLTRETGWTPVRDGNALLAYRHWEADGGSAGTWQDVFGLVPGERYVFTVYANRDAAAPGLSLAESIELRVETIGSPARHLETRSFAVEEIATGSRWSRLQLRFVATENRHRVLIVAYPGASPRDGAVKFDGLVLTEDDGLD